MEGKSRWEVRGGSKGLRGSKGSHVRYGGRVNGSEGMNRGHLQGPNGEWVRRGHLQKLS